MSHKIIGINSISDLNNKGNKFCLIREDNKKLEIIPSKNDTAKKYFGHLPDLAECIDFDGNYDAILTSIKKALAKCK